MMTVDDAMQHLDKVLGHESLNAIHEEIFRQAWKGKTYEEIATQHNYDTDYIRHIGQKLWQRLSQQMEQHVTKRNLQVAFRRHHQRYTLWQESMSLPATLRGSSRQYRNNQHLHVVQSPSEATLTHPLECLDRYGSLRTLQQWLNSDHARLVAILGLGGIGKTTLIRQLLKQVQDDFEVVIWRSLRNGPPFSMFMENLLTACPGLEQPLPSVDGQVHQILTYFQQRRCLLILDNYESILQPQALNGQYQTAHAPYGQLLRTLADHTHQSCLILTSRETPVGLGIRGDSNSLVHMMHLHGLSAKAAQTIMATFNIKLSNEEADKVNEIYMGNPYALRTAAATIRDLFQGNIQTWLQQKYFMFGAIYQLLSQQLERLTPPEWLIIQDLATQQTPRDLAHVQASLGEELSATQILDSLQSLLGRSLLEVVSHGFLLYAGIRQFLQLADDPISSS